MNDSVSELVDMAKALSENEFQREFQQDFQDELGKLASYLEVLRQTLQSLAVTAHGYRELIPKAADGVADLDSITDLNQCLVDPLLAKLR